jgi:hypothetical protein
MTWGGALRNGCALLCRGSEPETCSSLKPGITDGSPEAPLAPAYCVFIVPMLTKIRPLPNPLLPETKETGGSRKISES